MASVQLESVEEEQKRPRSHTHFGGVPVGGIAQTGFDGTFTLPNVPPGSYYVVAAKAGYLPSRDYDDDNDAAEPSPAEKSPIVLPRIEVQADQTASIDIRLERGAAVSGTVRFDDGSPAYVVQVVPLHLGKDKWVPSSTPILAVMFSPETDDLGHYRISGLRDREYVVMVQLTRTNLESKGTHEMGHYGVERSTLRIYSGDTPHISDAVPFKLAAGEERTGEDIVIPLSKLHSVNGVVTAASDGRVITGGHIVIEDPGEKESVVDAELGNDGSFHLEGVPEGTYRLRVRNARDTESQTLTGPGNVNYSSDKILHQFGDLEQLIKVEGDIPNLVLAVPEQTKQHAAQ
jgi:hypothetical protein